MPRHGSDSDAGYRSKSHRKKSRKKSRKTGSSSGRSSRSSSEKRSSSSERQKHKRHSGSHSRNHSRHKYESSHSKKHRRRSRSKSNESGESRTSQKKHASRTKHRHRDSSSRSNSRGRSSRTSRQSRSPSEKRSKSYKSKIPEPSSKPHVREDASMHEKLQAALKAAAVADAQLRQRGLLPTSSHNTEGKSNELTVAQQMKRAQAIEEINATSFSQQEFTSTRSWGKKTLQPEHENASSEVEILSQTPIQVEANGTFEQTADDWKENPEKLIHQNLFEDPAVKMERWKKKWNEMRRKHNHVEFVS